MTCQVYLVGTDVPVWVNEAPDLFIARVENASPSDMLRVTVIACHNDSGEEPFYEERAGYVRADQVAYVSPLGPKAREHLAEARGA